MAQQRDPREDGETQGSASAVRSVDRALALLECVAGFRDGATLAELSARSGLPSSTTHRLLTALQQRSFLRFDRRSGRWSVGRTALGVGAAYAGTRDLVALARPIMTRAAKASGETINLGILDDGEVTFLYRVDPRRRNAFVPPASVRVPAYCSSIGKALLSWLPDHETRPHVEGRELAPLTPHTLVSPRALRAQFADVRQHGFALDDEENTPGLRCLAASVFDEYHRPVAALSLAAPIDRLNPRQAAEAGHLIAAMARDLSTALAGTVPGGDGPAVPAHA
jgi:IclR family acetate operon transcriptional repressor